MCKNTSVKSEPVVRTTVVNLRREAYDVYIGRAGHGKDGYFGNPHPVGFCKICNTTHKRGEAVTAFEADFYERTRTDSEYQERVRALKGKTLGCFCKPKSCHGDVIAEYLDSLGTCEECKTKNVEIEFDLDANLCKVCRTKLYTQGPENKPAPTFGKDGFGICFYCDRNVPVEFISNSCCPAHNPLGNHLSEKDQALWEEWCRSEDKRTGGKYSNPFKEGSA